MISAPDCLRFFEHCRRYAVDPDCLGACAYSRQAPPPAGHRALDRRRWFTPWGWATWADRFAEMDRDWAPAAGPESWDVWLNRRVRRERYMVHPRLARVPNVGAELGAHVRGAEWHRRTQFNESRARAGPVAPGTLAEPDGGPPKGATR